MKKIISAVLLASVLLSTLASCGDGGLGAFWEGGRTPALERTVGDDGLPEKLDFGGKTVNILMNAEGSEDFTRKSITNDVLNDVIYNRSARVEERLGIKLKYHADTNNDAEGVCVNSILTGLDEYQILADGAISTFKLGANAYLLDILGGDLKYIDTSREWWNSYLVDNASVYGKCTAITGAFSLGLYKEAYATFFNKTVAEENGIKEDFYKLVREGKWTVDKQLEICRGLYSDVTGNGKTDDDRYGLLFDDCCSLDAYWSAFDLSLMTRTDDGGLALTEKNEKFANAVSKLYSMMYENGDVLVLSALDYKYTGKDDMDMAEIFASDSVLFASLRFRDCDLPIIRDMKSDYGIIPMPKWDGNQKDYYTFVQDGYTVFAVPKTVIDRDAVSATLEALAIESYKSVAPVYYDRILNGRYMRDLESSEMLDRVVDNIKLDYAWIHTFAMEKMAQMELRYLLRDGNSSFASHWRANRKRYSSSLTDLLKAYEKLGK